MRVFIYVIFSISVLYANVNPFVVLNTKQLHGEHFSIIPLPEKQIKYAVENAHESYRLTSGVPIRVLIKPHETLFVKTDNNKAHFSIERSVDGRLFHQTGFDSFEEDTYRYLNRFNDICAIKILTDLDANVTLFTTYNDSPLNRYRSEELNLPGEEKEVVSFPSLTTKRYDYFDMRSHFNIQVKGPGTLILRMRETRNSFDDVRALRKRISLQMNEGEEQNLESLNSGSNSYINESVKMLVSEETIHYLPLNDTENNVTIKTHGEILLKAEVYNDDLFNPTNDTNLSWHFKNNFEEINQPIWKNSRRGDGLQRLYAICSNKDSIQDSFQKKNLQSAAKRSTFMKQLYPTRLPDMLPMYSLKEKGGEVLHPYQDIKERGYAFEHSYYAPYKLYLDSRKAFIDVLSEAHFLSEISKIGKGVFTEVPEEIYNAWDVNYTHSVKKIYRDPLDPDDEKTLESQVAHIIEELRGYSKISLLGCTARVDNVTEESTVCMKIQKSLIAQGISSDFIEIVPETKPLYEHGFEVIRIEASKTIEASKHLEYSFSKPLEEEREFEITLLAEGNSSKVLFVDINGQDRQTYLFEPDEYFLSSAFSHGAYAYEHLKNREGFDSEKILSVINASHDYHFYKNSATIKVIVPKGTKKIRFSRPLETDSYKVTLKMRDKSIYRDTLFAWTDNYPGSDAKFAKTLDTKIVENKIFDPWYEHTHPLRLWFNAQIEQINKRIDIDKLHHKDMLQLLAEHKQYQEKFTLEQIAIHALMLSDDKQVIKEALDILLDLSENSKERLKWFAAYFYKTADSDTLGEMAQLLYREGQYRFALDIVLLMDRGRRDTELLHSLALLENRFKFYEKMIDPKRTFDNDTLFDNDALLRQKQTLLQKRSYTNNVWKNDIKVNNSAGASEIYAQNRDLAFTHHKATLKQPLHIEVEGPSVLGLDIRFMSQVDRYRWMKIIHNQKEYYFPVVHTKISPLLEDLNENRAISINNRLELMLGEGNHTLLIYGYDEPFLIGLERKDIGDEVIQPLDEQLLHIPDNYQRSSQIKEGANLAYASSLLWEYEFGNEDDIYHAQAKAHSLNHLDTDRYTKKIFDIIREYSSFEKYVSVNSEMGYFNEKVSAWNPVSVTQRSRSTLLHNIEGFHTVLYGNDSRIFHLEGSRNITFEVQQIHPDYFPYEALHFEVQVDENEPFSVILDKTTKRYVKKFSLAKGAHSIRVNTISPLSTHYLGINLYENGKRVEQDLTQRSFISTKTKPIQLTLKGPKLLRIDEKSSTGELITHYRYLPHKKIYRESFISSVGEESLMRFFEMKFNPLKRKLEQPERYPQTQGVFAEDVFSMRKLEVILVKNRSPNRESLDSTWSFELGYKSVDLYSDDNVESSSEAIPELGVYHRWKMDNERYLKQHLFVRFYDNPMYAIKNKLYTRVPFEDLWLSAELNGYAQGTEREEHTNIYASAELFKKEPLSENLIHKYGLRFFRNFMRGDPIEDGIVDPLVYSKYKKNHQYGMHGIYALSYYPKNDLMFTYGLQLTSNESLNTLDYVKNRFSLYHHVSPFDLNLFYENRYYSEDRHRPEKYTISDIGGKVRYEKFFDTKRLELELGLKHRIETDESNFFANIVWHHSGNDNYYNFLPNEKIFSSLKRLLKLTSETK
ncbi:MAG: hypothetical protein U9O64_06395 [Campylobacterota bacterium]|nr:hypothetical protein [Campylobacterota bacterium]